MSPLKWNIIFFLGGITLIAIGVKSEPLPQEIKSSSVKECRVHIEKALEQYWDKKGPSDNLDSEENSKEQPLENEENKSTFESMLENESREQDDERDNDDEDEAESNLGNDDANENEAEDDDDDSDEDQEKIDNKTTEKHDDEEDDIDLNNSDTSAANTDEHKDRKENRNEPKNLVENSNNVGDEDDDNDEEADDDEDEKETDVDNEEQVTDDENEGETGEDEPDDDTDNEDETNDDDEDETNDNDEDETNDNDEDEINNDEEDETNDDDEEENLVENEADVSSNKIQDNKLIREETDNEEENDDTDNDDEKEKNIDSEEDDGTETNMESNLQKDKTPDQIHIEIQIAKDKVTGEADSSSTRVASKFLDEKPSFEQSPEEKNLNESLIIEDSDDDDEDQESESVNEIDEKDDDSIENIYEEEDDVNSTLSVTYRNRDHIDIILGLDEIGTEYDDEEEKLAQNIFKDIKKIHLSQIKPMEMLYKYTDSTTRVLTDAEVFNKPMLIFLGPWSSGKTSIINYLLGIERTPAALKTGTGVTDVDFTLITYGDQKRVTSGTELAADWRYAGVQKFGQGFLDHFRSIQIKHALLKKITIVDTPGILENKKNAERGYSLSEAFQWFIDRSDAIYVVLDPTKVDIGAELGSIVDQLKGRDARFILNKADTIRRSDLMRVVGQLFWNLSPLMSSTEAPVIYAVSLTTKPYHPSAPAKFLADQEKNFFYDMKDTLEKRVENRILYARRHAVRVRNHAKMVDCYLATYYRHKSIFSSKRNVAKLIIDNPSNYNIFDGLGGITNVSRNDLPDPTAYKDFFKLHPLYDFKPLASTCSYFRGCPMDKLDLAISKDIPELLAKYKKKRSGDSIKQER